MNILQIDLEPWYFDLPDERWAGLSENVVANTQRILDALDATNNRATFFTLEDVVRHHPSLVAEIQDRGHEVGSHGTRHLPLYELSEEGFRDGVLQSLEALEHAGIDEIDGYRAPQFSLDRRSTWALDVLDDLGFSYDSSVFPVQTPLYGVPNAPRSPYHIDHETLMPKDESALFEVPPSSINFPVRNIPIAGGFYLRLCPYWLFKRGLNRVQQEGLPLVCYIHPWELDPEMTRVDDYGWVQYYNIGGAMQKFERLLQDFNFTTTRRYINGTR